MRLILLNRMIRLETLKTKIVTMTTTEQKERSRILGGAARLFQDSGMYKSSMDELASELGISKKTIYKYFPSKENLVKEVTKYWMTASVERVNEIVKSKSDVITKFVQLLENYSSGFTALNEKLIKDYRMHFPESWKLVERFREEKIFYFARKLFRQGLREKYVLNIPVEVVITAHTAALHAVVNPGFLIENNIPMKDALKYIFEMQMNGILTEKGRKKYNEKKKKHITK